MVFRVVRPALFCAIALLSLTPTAFGQSALDYAFAGADQVDLRTSQVASVVRLRTTVGIPASETPILVKTFRKETLPDVLKPVFAKKGTAGVTINGRYIAILQTPFAKEYHDILQHELVHAYITTASPKPLPFWFQEASAVHFSTDKGRKFYGHASKKKTWVMEGKVVDLTPTYKQKLQSFHFLIEKVGKERFYEWYKDAVMTGTVDARPLLGLDQAGRTEHVPLKKPISGWVIAVIAGVVIVIAVAGYVSVKRGGDYY